MSEPDGRRPRLFTMGHSNLSEEEFLSTLEHSSIRLVADIRSNPASARFPHFERSALSASLEKRAISYRWFRDLGGRRPETPGEEEHTAFKEEWMRRYAAHMNTPSFKKAVNDLFGVATSTQVVVLCAEKDFKDCHRNLLADKLVLMGARVVHIVGDGTAPVHLLHPDLSEENGYLVYKRKQIELF